MTLARHAASIVRQGGSAGALKRLGAVALAALALPLTATAPAGAQPPAAADPRVLVVFHPGGVLDTSRTVFERLALREELSLGWLGATQGTYSVRQTLLDITQGHRLSRSGYEPESPPPLELRGNRIGGWRQAVRRARTAPARMVPGLLAGSIPGGGAYAGVGRVGRTHVEAVLAADRRGRIAAVSLGLEDDLVERTRRLLGRHRFVVASLAAGPGADEALDELTAQRRPQDLLIVVRTPPRSRSAQLLPIGTAGLDDGRGAGLLRSRTTRRDGLVAGHDVLPTVLDHLELPIPDEVRGFPMFVTGERDVDYLRALERRLRVVFPRRFPSLFAVAAAVLLIGTLGGRRGRRVAGLAFLWIPTVSLLAAALEPSRAVEISLMAAGSVGLGLATDRLVRWPRAPAVPAIVGTVAYMADLVAGSPLIVRSLLGPNPRFGARWYGIGNELEAALPVLLLIGIAAAAGATPRSRRLALGFALPMLVLGLMVGAGRLGADVGGVITIGAGAAAAVVVALPGGPSRRSIALACAVPVAAVAVLAVVDLLTRGDSHFVASVLGVDDAGDLLDVARRRVDLALRQFLRGLMPVATVLAVVAVVLAYRRRDRLYGPVAGRPAWAAAMVGGAAGGIVGSIANDSGPVLLVIGVAVLGAGTAYVRGGEGLEAADSKPASVRDSPVGDPSH